ncbi:MAG: hypothetical protein EU536_00325 [Promethearchaeota archaeon]|nr:MAG: hypothetical protein EU536_00325 [Candidatus Lokiarchaeota archaeon]
MTERKERRRKIAERRRLRQDDDVVEQGSGQGKHAELLVKFGIVAVLAFIPIDFFIKFYPIITNSILSFEVSATAYIFMQVMGILFGLGLCVAGIKMTRDTGKWGGVLQVDGSIIGIVSVSIYLIVSPLSYTQQDVIVNSLFYGLETVSSITLLIFTLLTAFFFILIGSNSQVKPLKYIIIGTGFLWLVQLFIPAFRPSPFVDLALYSVVSSIAWVVYGLTAFALWKIMASDDLIPSPTAPYRIK